MLDSGRQLSLKLSTEKTQDSIGWYDSEFSVSVKHCQVLLSIIEQDSFKGLTLESRAGETGSNSLDSCLGGSINKDVCFSAWNPVFTYIFFPDFVGKHYFSS